jgi:predicted house-cleaning noncanonical NTP pyrophosphatase (MazG superfamily)
MRHEKLVRDNIPAIIAQHGEQPVTRILEIDEYKHELRRKLHEEVVEFCATGHVEELADVLEVVYALASLEGVSSSRLEEIRQRKQTERGGFSQRIFLIETRAAGVAQ